MVASTGTMQTVDGIELLTVQWDAETPRGTVLIVHGVSEHTGRWGHVAEHFVARGYNVRGYDLRGHGKSGGPQLDLEDFDMHVGDLERMVDAVRQPDLPLIIYGHSMGGLIATRYSYSSRPQPDIYVLSAPALANTAPALLKMAVNVLARVAPGIRLASPLKGEQLSRDPKVGEAYFSDPLVHLKGTPRFGKALLSAMEATAAQTPDFKVQTLVIHGSDDSIVPPSASAPLAASALSDRKLFTGLRHEMHNEPEQGEVLSFVSDWLDAKLSS